MIKIGDQVQDVVSFGDELCTITWTVIAVTPRQDSRYEIKLERKAPDGAHITTSFKVDQDDNHPNLGSILSDLGRVVAGPSLAVNQHPLEQELLTLLADLEIEGSR
jgi:hypothetical protein